MKQLKIYNYIQFQPYDSESTLNESLMFIVKMIGKSGNFQKAFSKLKDAYKFLQAREKEKKWENVWIIKQDGEKTRLVDPWEYKF